MSSAHHTRITKCSSLLRYRSVKKMRMPLMNWKPQLRMIQPRWGGSREKERDAQMEWDPDMFTVCISPPAPQSIPSSALILHRVNISRKFWPSCQSKFKSKFDMILNHVFFHHRHSIVAFGLVVPAFSQFCRTILFVFLRHKGRSLLFEKLIHTTYFIYLFWLTFFSWTHSCSSDPEPDSELPCDFPCSCEVTKWEQWTPCSITCTQSPENTGFQSRRRHIVMKPSPGGASCPVLEHTRQCPPEVVSRCER